MGRWFFAGGAGRAPQWGARGDRRVRTAAGSLTGENFVSSFSSATPPPGRRPSSRPSVRGEAPTTSVETESMLEERRSHSGGGGSGLVPSRANLAAGGAAPSPLPWSLKSIRRTRCWEAPVLLWPMGRLGVRSGDVLNFTSSAAASTALCVRLMAAPRAAVLPSGSTLGGPPSFVHSAAANRDEGWLVIRGCQ